jgi:hypothetical protein
MIQTALLWILTSFSVTGRNQRFGSTCYHLPIRLHSVVINKATAYIMSFMCIYILLRNHTGSGTHPSIPRIPGFLPGGKAAGAWSWPLTSLHCQG